MHRNTGPYDIPALDMLEELQRKREWHKSRDEDRRSHTLALASRVS